MPRVARPRRWATVSAGAEYIGTSKSTFRRMLASGEVPSYRYGARIVRVDLNELDDRARRIPAAEASVA